jgi:hypothetical protein
MPIFGEHTGEQSLSDVDGNAQNLSNVLYPEPSVYFHCYVNIVEALTVGIANGFIVCDVHIILQEEPDHGWCDLL